MKKNKKTIVFIIFFLLISRLCSAANITILTEEQAQIQIDGDIKLLSAYRTNLEEYKTFINSHPELFSQEKLTFPRLLSSADRDNLRLLWQSILDYYLSLDSLGKFYHRYYKIKNPELKALSFLIFYEAFLLQYQFALSFITYADGNPAIGTLFDETISELGLPAGTYSQFKFRFLNVARGIEFAALDGYYHTLSIPHYSDHQQLIRQDAKYLWDIGKGHGEIMTVKNGLKIIKGAGFAAYFPVQAGISEWMGNTKVRRLHSSLITAAQIQAMVKILQPGDVLLERREWYLSNIGLPGFWTHAALYIGTAEERRQYFADEETTEWVKKREQPDGDFENLLQKLYPAAYKISTTRQEQQTRVLEAISEGVSFTTIEHSADCDSLVILRPRLNKKDKAAAIFKAFHYSGRPYDFNFDFLTDSSLVCTELIYKAYEPAVGKNGLKLPLIDYMGHILIPANEIAKQFSTQYGTAKQQFDLILFLDGYEKTNSAKEAAVEEFLSTWQRPKWHILTQK